MRFPAALTATFCIGLGLPVWLHGAQHWLLIDTTASTLTLMNGESAVTVYENIAIGQNGTTRDKILHDGRTPLGAYRISAIREQSRFYRFFAIDYPGLSDARDAAAAGTIDEATYVAIRHAHEHGRAPPQDTPLGGNLGIHGTGNGDSRVHEDFNWTDGCVALTNDQIDELTPYVVPGMIVVIR